MPTTIKQLTNADLDLFIEASKIFYEKDITQNWAQTYLSNPDNFYYLAFVADEMAGFVAGNYIDIWQSEYKEIFVYDIEVLENFRRKGIAKSLIQKAIDDGKALGHKNPWVLSEPDNIPAKALYSSFSKKTTDSIMFDL